MYMSLQTENKPLSSRSVLKAHLVIKEALDRALKWGLVQRNVADMVDPPQPTKAEIKVWDAESAVKFLELAKKTRYYIVFMLVLTTGMWKGGILGLRWEDIDLDMGRLSIRQALGRDRLLPSRAEVPQWLPHGFTYR